MAFNIGDLPIVLSELTCSKCDKFLSVLPIYTFSNIGDVCGRCATATKQSTSMHVMIQRNAVYECLAKHVLLFPCSNKEFGCTTSLKYDEVVDHEECCIYRQHMCPFNVVGFEIVLECDWKGTIIDLGAHFNLRHTSGKTNNSHTFTLMKEPYIQVNYAEVESYTFVVITRLTALHKFHCLVMCCAEEEVCRGYAYQIDLGQEDDFLKKFCQTGSTSMLLDTSDALEMVEHTIAFDVNAALNFFGNLDLDLKCRISITKKPNQIVKAITSMPKEPSNSEPTSSDAKPNMSHSNKLILEELECPVCNNYMKPPIYICTQGHSLCNECKIKVNGCPICRVSSVGIRNFTLEKLTQKVLYPCRYSHNGCTEALSGCVIEQHQTTCNFRSNCALFSFTGVQCDNVDKDVRNQISHIYEQHSDILTKVNSGCSINIKSRECIYRVVITNGEVFIFCFKNSLTADSIKINFLHLMARETDSQYVYELEFIDQTSLKLSFFVQCLCQYVRPTVRASLSDAFKKCLTIPLDRLGPYIMTNDRVHFKLYAMRKMGLHRTYE